MNRFDLSEATQPDAVSSRIRGTVRLAAFLNIAYFGIEVAVALAIGSVSLFADSIDFLEDTTLNLLILVGLKWSARNRARVGMVLSGLLLVPGVATLWTAGRKFTAPVPPSPLPLSLAGAGALAVNMTFGTMLARYRQRSGSLTRAAFLSARNDVVANIAIIGAGLLTAYTRSAWQDLVVGIGIALMNSDSAKEPYQLAWEERRTALPNEHCDDVARGESPHDLRLIKSSDCIGASIPAAFRRHSLGLS